MANQIAWIYPRITVLILHAVRFRDKRLVFLNQLDYGQLVITGLFKVDSVQFRRVNQAYIIFTSNIINVGAVDQQRRGMLQCQGLEERLPSCESPEEIDVIKAILAEIEEVAIVTKTWKRRFVFHVWTSIRS
ncbi:hypothetical protein E3Q22_04407 [Wallemia mellicola]|uniref:Uncharacterized protein n=1 Tax=Wallemia mellicola TaxID=1708541 RepID=A0A4T0RT54_9BASI|nr:hypothetical protein E3Q24_03343 [Wallemia mellicola]TIB72894.1 hypothetical protein E3Q22_04407 [Wallemia mellicola]TIC05372.1 hypothetical protein E3Q16_02167 [Wallemia mellicola]TIC06472.1 hypothetical protein E3Q15_04427 [Wallemia mellicola]TIC06779.1 hypothetical protein E3Q14_04428 [Wallemia mellicola]